MLNTPERYDLSAVDAATLLGVHRDTLARWTDEHKVRAWVTPGGHRRYRRADILALLPDDRDTSPAA